MPKQARVAILMIAMVVFAVAMLDLVRSKVQAGGRALKTAAVQYSSVRKVYAALPGELAPSSGNGAQDLASGPR